jgi:hypothetical protein
LGGTGCSQSRSRTVTEGRHGAELIGGRLLVCLAFTKGRKPIKACETTPLSNIAKQRI